MLLRMLWVFAKEVLAMDLGPNPAAEIRKLHHQGWSHEPWPDRVIEKFEAEASRSRTRSSPLCCSTIPASGPAMSSECDGATMTERGSQVRQLKTGTPLWIRCHLELKAMLDRIDKKSEFILTTRHGRGYSAHGLCQMIRTATAQIGADECSAHGLRCNAATALAEAGCSVPADYGHHRPQDVQGGPAIRQPRPAKEAR